MFFSVLICWQSIAFTMQEPQTGKYIEKYENGKIKVKGKLKNGMKQGNWYYYSPNHVIQKREQYKNGILKRALHFNEKGQLVTIVLENGKEIPQKACGCN